MAKFSAFVLATLLIAMNTSTRADDRFDYASVNHLYVLTETEAIRFGRFPAFHELRDVIADAMAKSTVGGEATGETVHVVRLFNASGETTVLIGNTWIRDGERIAPISPTEFRRLDEAIRARRGTGSSRLKSD